MSEVPVFRGLWFGFWVSRALKAGDLCIGSIYVGFRLRDSRQLASHMRYCSVSGPPREDAGYSAGREVAQPLLAAVGASS